MFPLPLSVTATACGQMDNETVKKLWNGFALTLGQLKIIPCEELIFRVGQTELPELPADKEYALRVDEKGIALVGKDFGGLMRGFMVLLMKIEYRQKAFSIRPVDTQSHYRIGNRMIHICVFPENDLYFRKMFYTDLDF